MAVAQVLIVGAGPTGLVLALGLVRHGVSCRIVDKNVGPGTASRAIVVHARTLEFYQQLGFAQEVIDRGFKLETARFREGDEEVAQLQFQYLGAGLSPFPFILSYPQDDHERFLVEKLKVAGVAVEWGTELKEFTDDGEHVKVVLEKAGTEETVEVGYLCGCDGAHSRVRKGLGLEFPGGTYDQIFYVADADVEGETNPDFTVNLGTGDFALMFPVRSSGMQRLIGIVPEAAAKGESIVFEDVRESIERLIDRRVATVNWFSTYHVHHRVAAHFRAGRVFIAGDAGHVHSPAGGQGMNTGIGDAINLSWKLASVLQGKSDTALLDTYETERIAFARTLVSTTDRAFTMIIGQGLPSQILRTWLLPHVLPFLAGFSAVRRTMFTTVSQTRINYHESALSEGEAGHIQGGDRLPWVSTDTYDNFAPLTAMAWQVHVYGEASPALHETTTSLGLDLQTFAWTDEAEHAGFERDALYLVRPDGYVALAASQQDTEKLRNFAAKFMRKP